MQKTRVNDIPYDMLEYMSSEDTDWDSAWMQYTDETLLWECKDGTIIAIEDMKTSHIKNCIAMIEKSIKTNKPWRIEYLNSLKAELASRKELNIQ